MQATVIQPQQYVHPLPLATTRPRRTPASGANRPHRGLRCPPGTYFSPRSLRSNPSDLEENAVLEHKVRPRHRAQPHPRHLPASRGPTPLERAEQPARRGRTTRPADRIPRISPQPVRCALAARPARTTTCAPVRPSGPPPRTCQALRVRPRRSACPDSTGSLPSHSQESPSQQPRSLKNPRLSGGTSGRYWAASADSLRAYRRPSGQSLWNSWTPCPTCGVCVTTTLPQCPNGVRDH